MTIQVDCPRYWRSREEQIRALIPEAIHPIAKTALTRTAEVYKRLAERAERREQGGEASR